MTTPITQPDLMEVGNLTDAAKCVAGGWFGIMPVGKGELTFQLRTSKPSPWAQDALNELVAAKVVSVEAFNKWGGLVYRPLVDCHWAHVWLAKNRSNPAASQRLTVPVESEKDAREHQRAALRARTPVKE